MFGKVSLGIKRRTNGCHPQERFHCSCRKLPRHHVTANHGQAFPCLDSQAFDGEVTEATSPGQIGGFAHMQVPFGSQQLQVFGRIMDAKGYSSAVVFFDLTNAFHRLIRELVSGIHVPSEVEAVLEALVSEGIPAHEVGRLLELPSLLKAMHAPPFLIQLLQDLHTDTWLKAPGDDRFIVTRRGTRPGSPLADCIFHILMADVTNVLAKQEAFQGLLAAEDIEADCIMWAR